MARRDRFVISAEHAGCRVPARYAPLFRARTSWLHGHRGWDPGSPELARDLARALAAALHSNRITRLLADTNRSPHHPALFSAVTRPLPPDEKRRILDRWYRPHRAHVEASVRTAAARGGRAIHLAVHTFTPRWKGAPRPVDVGLLYDPGRPGESDFCRRWKAEIQRTVPGLRVRRNQPYRGVSDGLATHLRKSLDHARYLGIELEVNQRFPLGPSAAWRRLRGQLVESLRAVVHHP